MTLMISYPLPLPGYLCEDFHSAFFLILRLLQKLLCITRVLSDDWVSSSVTILSFFFILIRDAHAVFTFAFICSRDHILVHIYVLPHSFWKVLNFSLNGGFIFWSGISLSVVVSVLNPDLAMCLPYTAVSGIRGISF